MLLLKRPRFEDDSTRMGEKVKIVVLHNIFTPHIVPLFKKISDAPGIDLKVLFTSFTSPERNWAFTKHFGFEYEILPKIIISYQGKDFFSYVINPAILYCLWKERLDILVAGGYDSFSSQIGFFFCKIFHKPYILWSGSTAYENNWRRMLAKPLIKTLVRNADALLAYGSRSRDFLIDLGAREVKVVITPNTVDIDYFAKGAQLSDEEKKEMKKTIGIETSQIILYVGQLIERKGLHYLLSAFDKLKREHPDISLLIVGKGYQERRLKAICEDEKILDVFFVGHKDYDNIPKYYGISDVFVLPSLEEVWGLAVNEAMACSLPVIVTRKVGASVDLVKEGINGNIIREGEIDELYQALKRLSFDLPLRKKMGKESFHSIQNFSIEEATKKFLHAINICLIKHDTKGM